jgi:hypothetical protein
VFIGCGCGRSVKGKNPGQRYRSVPTAVTINIPPRKCLFSEKLHKDSYSPPKSVRQGEEKRQKHGEETRQRHGEEKRQKQGEERIEFFSLLVEKYRDRDVEFDPDAKTRWMETGRASAIATVCPVDGDCRKMADEDAQQFTRLDFWLFETRVYMRCLSGCEDASTKKEVITVLSVPNKKK